MKHCNPAANDPNDPNDPNDHILDIPELDYDDCEISHLVDDLYSVDDYEQELGIYLDQTC